MPGIYVENKIAVQINCASVVKILGYQGIYASDDTLLKYKSEKLSIYIEANPNNIFKTERKNIVKTP